jgi:hypothetical protein
MTENDNNLARWAQFARDTLSTRLTPEQIRALETPAPPPPSATATTYRPLTNDELREKRCEIVRRDLDRNHPGHDCTEEDIKAYVAVALSDEVIAQNIRDWHAQKRAEQEQAAAQWALELEAKKAAAKVAQGHNAALTTERKKATTYQERAEAAEAKAKGLEAQIAGLLKGQRT